MGANLTDTAPETTKPRFFARVLEVFLVATKLGLTAFGGPVAHIGYFRDEYVTRRRWLTESAFADLVALSQALPGPASSQVGIGVGTLRAGALGGLAAWIGFTLPSALLMIAFAYGVAQVDLANAGWLHGLKIAAVAVVAWAVWGMARTLTPDRTRVTLAIAATIAVLAWSGPLSQVAVLALAAIAGILLFHPAPAALAPHHERGIGRRWAILSGILFFALLISLPLLRQAFPNQGLAVFDSFYRTGSLVFGGGHVVLPLLQESVVPPGWVDQDVFLAGYGAAQAVPGPLFTFSAFLGAYMHLPPTGIPGAALALGAIFLPAFLTVFAVLPFWSALRLRPRVQAALAGVNAAVVGILLAALYDPVWTSAIKAENDFALGLAAFCLLAFWKAPPWLVIAFSAIGGVLLTL